MNVRAKFRCESKSERVEDDRVIGYEVLLRPVTGGSEENDTFFQYTPWGELRIGLVSKETAEHIDVGRDYFVDLVPAE